MSQSIPARISIEPMTIHDWTAVHQIYVEGIHTGNATFEKTAPDWEKWNAGHLSACRLVARLEHKVVGWAALAPASSRRVYAGVAEVSVYVAASARGQRVGSQLLAALVEASEKEGLWTLQAGIFPENKASIELHKRNGFRIVGTKERIGNMDGRWRDVLQMERRSAVVGV